MKLSIHDLGIIDKCTLELNDLTILVGDNNSGKTYITYSTYGALSNWNQYIKARIKNIKSISTTLKNEGQISLKYKEIVQILGQNTNIYNAIFDKNVLKDLFNDKEGVFKNAGVELSIDIPKSFPDTKKMIKVGDSITLEGEVKNNNINITYTKQDDRILPEGLFNEIITDLFSLLIFTNIFPTPYIITAERLGISLFYKELDERRNSMIEGLQKLDNSNEKFHPFELIKSMSAYYATPIRDHITFTRRLDNLIKYKSKLDTSYIINIIREMLGAEFKKESKHDIRFYTKNKKNNRFNIPLYLASSSARCIVDIYFYIKHKSKEFDILIIDEPESHLTLRNQRLLAKLITAMINIGIKVFITTHSDFLIKELNNLIMLSNKFEGKDKWLNEHKKCYSSKDELKSSKVSVYYAEEGKITSLKVTDKGIEVPFFDKELNNIFSISTSLDYLID